MGEEPTIAQRVGTAIRKKRTNSLGITQQDLADRLGISRPSVANIESGRQQLNIEQLFQFAAVLGVEPASLLPPSPRSQKLVLPDTTKPKIRKWAELLMEAHNE